MKTYNTIYFLLFMLLIMGAFASMAQNSYGLKLIGAVGVCFGLLFFYQLARYQIGSGTKNRLQQIELLCLTTFAFIISARIFNLHTRVTDIIFIASGLVLAGLYYLKLRTSYTALKPSQPALALLISCFYLSIILFIVFVVSALFYPQVSGVAWIGGFILLVIFIVVALVKGDFIIDGKNTSAFKWIIDARDRSGLLISLFSVVAVYFALNAFGMLPSLYIDDLPQAYYKLVKESNAGEKNKQGNNRHDEFKKEYDQFVNRNISGRTF